MKKVYDDPTLGYSQTETFKLPEGLTLVPVSEAPDGEVFEAKRDWTICLIKPLIVHKCIICIGSNYNRKENLLLARRRLVVVSYHPLYV